MNPKENNGIKQQMIDARRAEVERLHIQGYSIAEIAQRVEVDVRTVSRDIADNRKEHLKMIENSDGAREWLQGELADTIAFFDAAKKKFCQQAETCKSEASKIRALQGAVDIQCKRMETIKSLIWSLYDLQMGGSQLHRNNDL